MAVGPVPGWMVWNAALAAVPLACALVLFGGRRVPGAWWWIGAVVFAAFLPNAPYLLTDVKHLGTAVRHDPDPFALAFRYVPLFAGLLAYGAVTYAACVRRLTGFLRRRGWRPLRVVALEVAVHGACAVGIVLGRFFRLNSWQLVTDPGVVGRSAWTALTDPAWLRLCLVTTVVLVAVTACASVAGTALRVYALVRIRRPRG